MTTPDNAPSFKITLHRTELIPDGNGAMWGYSADYPGKQFLIFPSNDIDDYFLVPPFTQEDKE